MRTAYQYYDTLIMSSEYTFTYSLFYLIQLPKVKSKNMRAHLAHCYQISHVGIIGSCLGSAHIAMFPSRGVLVRTSRKIVCFREPA